MPPISKEKLEILDTDPNLAFLMELTEINKLLKTIKDKEITFPTPPDYPITDLSGVVSKLGEVLSAIQKQKAEEVNVTIKIV